MDTPILVEEALIGFLSFLSDEGDDDQTLRWYVSRLGAFVKLHHGPLDDITSDALTTYIGKLKGRRTRYSNAPQRPVKSGGLSHVTIRGHIRALKAFFRWSAGRFRNMGFSTSCTSH